MQPGKLLGDSNHRHGNFALPGLCQHRPAEITQRISTTKWQCLNCQYKAIAKRFRMNASSPSYDFLLVFLLAVLLHVTTLSSLVPFHPLMLIVPVWHVCICCILSAICFMNYGRKPVTDWICKTVLKPEESTSGKW